jgi:cell division protein FtsI/penicillin-binding protein 2
MQKKLQFRRAMCLVGLLCAAYLGLAAWLVDLQVFRHDELSAKAEQNTHREFFQNPRRGDILDVNGNILATSVDVKTICADPSLIGSQQPEVARALAPLLQMNEGDLIQKLTPRLGKNEKGEVVTNGLHYVRLARCVPEATWQRVQQAMTNLTFGVEGKTLPRAQRTFYSNLRQSAIF